ncbi:MAG: hypothetical protein ACM3UQ_00015 [Clostridiales bacterium]
MDPDCPDCDTPLVEFDLLSGIFHCPNPKCGFIYFDKNTGKKYRKSEDKRLQSV